MRLSDLLYDIEPTVRGWIAEAIGDGAQGGGSGVPLHALTDHTGTLDPTQAPWALTQAALDAHAGNPDAHHPRVHNILGADHTGSGAALDLIGFTAIDTLGKITPSSAPGAARQVLATDSSGYLTLVRLLISDRIRSSLFDTASGNISLSPAGGTVTVTSTLAAGTVTASTKVTAPLVDAAANMEIKPTGSLTLSPGGTAVLPLGNAQKDLGDYIRQWRTLFVSEIYAQTLVAAKVLATVGGEIIVTPTTKLIADVNTSQTTIDVKENNLQSGEFAVLRTAPSGIQQAEVLKITSSATAISGGYRYTVERNKDGTGANSWLTGDAVASLGRLAGHGYLYLASVSTIHNHIGPTMIVYSRRGTDTWNNIDPVVAVGNLRSLVDYASDETGIAIGKDLEQSFSSFIGLTADATNGVRLANVSLSHYTGGNLFSRMDTAAGLTFFPSTSYVDYAGYTFADLASGNHWGGMWAYVSPSGYTDVRGLLVGNRSSYAGLSEVRIHARATSANANLEFLVGDAGSTEASLLLQKATAGTRSITGSGFDSIILGNSINLKLSLGNNSPRASADFYAYETWTAFPWRRHMLIANASGQPSAIQFGYGSGTRYGMGQSGGTFYLFSADGDASGSNATTRLRIDSNGVSFGDALGTVPTYDINLIGIAYAGVSNPYNISPRPGVILASENAAYMSMATNSWGNAGILLWNAYATNTSGGFFSASNVLFVGTQYLNNTRAAGLYFDGNAHYFTFNVSQTGLATGGTVSWTELVRIHTSGVGIFTAGNPAYELEVVGNGRFSEFVRGDKGFALLPQTALSGSSSYARIYYDTSRGELCYITPGGQKRSINFTNY